MSVSMPYLYEVFEHLLRMWMGIWLHTHTITTTDASPDLGKMDEIQSDASVQTMPLCFDWGCRTFQTASHVHVIHIWCVWAYSNVVDGHMVSYWHRYHHRFSPDLEKLVEILPDASVQTMPYTLIESVLPFNLHPMSMVYLYEVFEYLLRLWMGIWLHIHIATITDTSPELWKLAEILPDASVQTMPLHFGWGCRTFLTAFHVHAIPIWGVWAPQRPKRRNS